MKEVITSAPEIDNEELLRMLDTRIVDFSDIKEVTDFALLICQSASHGGMFLKDGQDKELLEHVRTIAKEWVKEIRLRIASMPVSDALEVIQTFDLVHRIAYDKAADVDFINKYTLKAFEARIHGDQTVNEYTLFRQIAVGLNRRDPSYLDRPLEWYTLSLDRWYKEFSNPKRPLQPSVYSHNHSSQLSQSAQIPPKVAPSAPTLSADPKSDYDTINRINILLTSDLYAFTPKQKEFKNKLLTNYSIYFPI